jgi:hypothetical protein
VEPKTIFTCTTYFDFEKQNRWESFERAIGRIHAFDEARHIQGWLIVNEYSESPRMNWVELMAVKYPYMKFVQKTKDKKGQAASLNIILEHIGEYDYWLQWEDSWFPERGFLDRALHIMNGSDITQLQFTKLNGKVNWLETPKERQTHWCDFIEIRADPDVIQVLDKPTNEFGQSWIKSWPLFSLLPSINRVRHIVPLGRFNTDPALWPVKFEWDFGRRWYKAGGRKAVLPDGPVMRYERDHVSTWGMKW